MGERLSGKRDSKRTVTQSLINKCNDNTVRSIRRRQYVLYRVCSRSRAEERWSIYSVYSGRVIPSTKKEQEEEDGWQVVLNIRKNHGNVLYFNNTTP